MNAQVYPEPGTNFIVNGVHMPANEPMTLAPGDVLRIGDVVDGSSHGVDAIMLGFAFFIVLVAGVIIGHAVADYRA